MNQWLITTLSQGFLSMQVYGGMMLSLVSVVLSQLEKNYVNGGLMSKEQEQQPQSTIFTWVLSRPVCASIQGHNTLYIPKDEVNMPFIGTY